MFSSSLIDFVAGKILVQNPEREGIRKLALLLSICANLGLLGFFKYYVFTLTNLNLLIENLGLGPSYLNVVAVILPVGISFYTFQSMSYTIDIYRKRVSAAKDFRTFSCYVALFPQLVAGPIVRYSVIENALAQRKHSTRIFLRGCSLFILGFAKKILLANPVGEIADKVWSAAEPGILHSWWGNIAYMMQIYFDFSAYSEMAYGLGLMLGFRFVRNFNAPYKAKSITDFWGKWHMSLTQWFRDYLYIPLGGNRVKTKNRLYFNLLVVMLLSGVWHGAQWTFILWGAFHASFLIFERANHKKTIYAKFPSWIQIGITQFLVLIGWVLFRAPNLSEAGRMFSHMLGLQAEFWGEPLLSAQVFNSWSVLMMGLGAFFILQPLQGFYWSMRMRPYKLALLSVLMLWSCFVLFNQSYNPFLYFQF